MSPFFVVGSRGPSHGYITNAVRKNDLMVASYPCNDGGMLDMCVLRATSHEVGQALRSHIIVAMSILLRKEFKVTNRDVNKKIVEKRMVTTPFSQKCEDGHQDPSLEKDNIRYRNYVITNIHICIIITHIRSDTYTCDHICVY